MSRNWQQPLLFALTLAVVVLPLALYQPWERGGPSRAADPPKEDWLHAYLDPVTGKLAADLPDGRAVDMRGSTTDGLEETFRAMCDNHLSLRLDGSGNDPGYPGVINLSTPLDFRGLRAADGSRKPCPIQGKTIEIGWLTLNWTHSIGDADGITFDSIMALQFRFDGQAVYQGTGCAISFVPTHPVPIDNFVTAAASTVRMGYPVTQTPAGRCLIKLDARSGAIIDLDVSDSEANGGGCPGCKSSSADGLVLIGGTHGIQGSRFTLGWVHGWTKTGVQCGLDAADGAGIKGNYFRAALTPSAVSGSTIGVDLWCPHNEWHLSIDGDQAGSDAFTGVKVESGVAGNVVIVPRNEAAMPISGAPADIARNTIIR